MVKPKTKKPTWQHKIQGLLKKVRISPNQSVALFGLIFAVVGIVMLILSSASAPYKTESFSSDPHWDSYNNRVTSVACKSRDFNFGYNDHQIGGTFSDSEQYRAYYGMPLSRTYTLDDSLTASGTMIGTNASNNEILFGWFDTKTAYASQDWRTSDFFGIRFDDTRGTSNIVHLELGTKDIFSSAVDALSTIAVNQKFSWQISYQPTGGDFNKGLMTITVNGQSASASLTGDVREDGASFDHFGFMNLMLAEYNNVPKEVYVDSLSVNGKTIDISKDPNWDGSNNHLQNASDCLIFGRHDFGWSNDTKVPGSPKGQLGGIIWQSDQQAYYADKTQALSLNDRLYATGKLTVTSLHTDTDIPLIGWFNSSTVNWPKRTQPKNILAAQIGSTSEWGKRLTANYKTSEGTGSSVDSSVFMKSPIVTPRNIQREFWICYEPDAEVSGNGKITVGLVGIPSLGISDSTISQKVKVSDKTTGATFNHFGVISIPSSSRATTFYLDDLRYTTAPGDSGPSDRCPAKPDSNPPTVSLTGPADNSTISGTINIQAAASDDVGIAGVQFKVDNTNLGNELPDAARGNYSYSWDSKTVSNGLHELTVSAHDAAANNAIKTIHVTVNNPIPDTIAPSIPTNLHSVAASQNAVTLDWDISTDNNGGTGVGGYKVFRDGNYLTSVNTPHFTDAGLAANTVYKYSVSAYDNTASKPNESAQSPQLTVTTSAASGPPPGDVDGDGHVNIHDISVAISHYGQHTSIGDTNNDGVVDIKDISIIISNYGK